MSAELVPLTPGGGYTPTTEQVRESTTRYHNIAWTEVEFDRWLEQRDREVAVRTLRKTAGGFEYSAQQGIEPVLNRTVAKILSQVADNVERGEGA